MKAILWLPVLWRKQSKEVWQEVWEKKAFRSFK